MEKLTNQKVLLLEDEVMERCGQHPMWMYLKTYQTGHAELPYEGFLLQKTDALRAAGKERSGIPERKPQSAEGLVLFPDQGTQAGKTVDLKNIQIGVTSKPYLTRMWRRLGCDPLSYYTQVKELASEEWKKRTVEVRLKTNRNEGEDNDVRLMGEIIPPVIFSHIFKKDRIYRTQIKVDRYSDTPDILWLMLPESLKEIIHGKHGGKVMICGQLLSHNQDRDGGRKLLLSVSATDLKFISEADYTPKRNNKVRLHGYVCKPPIHRKTILGREITEIVLAVNRPDKRGDYIPCIFWGENAKRASAYPVGKELRVLGRFQSREYDKQRPDGTLLKKTAYEVSVKKILPV